MRFLLLLAAAACFALTEVAATDKKIVCYFGSWSVYRPGKGKFEIEDIDASLCTHLIYTFVALDEEIDTVKIIDPWQDLPDQGGHDGFRRFNELRDKHPNVTTLVAIGGWNEGSIKYSDMVSDPKSRASFVKSAVAFVIQYDFDGMDIDWEYPNQRGGETEDVENFSALIRELKEAFDMDDLVLSAAVAGPKSSASKSYNIAEISKYLDFINLLSYDFHGSWDNYTGINSPLYNGASDTGINKEWTVDASVHYWLSQGAPAEKLVVGIPFYGRSFTLASRDSNKVGDAIVGPGVAGPYTRQEGTLGYNEICEKQKRKEWTVKFDEERRVPYAYRGHQWVGYDNVQSVTEKSEYINKLGLGGAMIWSIETDDFEGICGEKYPLLKAMNKVLRNGT